MAAETRAQEPPVRRSWIEAGIEAGLLAGLFVLYLLGFGALSAIHGPLEVFGQDSAYILESLADGLRYPWNPQNHLLYHFLVETGYGAWTRLFGSGPDSAFHFLKLFTALSGLAFLLVTRRLLIELGLDAPKRIALLALTGFGVSVWFHFSGFETHGLPMPFLALYVLCVARLRDREHRSGTDRILLIGSLVVAGLVRVDLFRFALVSLLLPLLPGARRWWRSLAVDLALVAVLAVVGNALLVRFYMGVPLSHAAAALLQRDERTELEGRLSRAENLEPRNLWVVGRAIAFYGLLMPVEPRPPGRSFFAPPGYDLALAWPEDQEDRPSTRLFLEPLRNLFGSALSLLAFLGVAVLLANGVAWSLRRLRAGDPLHGIVVAQVLSGWLFYAWFNPFEPFLWVLQFVPLWIVMIADRSRAGGRPTWVVIGVAALLIGAHNLFAFYLPFS